MSKSWQTVRPERESGQQSRAASYFSRPADRISVRMNIYDRAAKSKEKTEAAACFSLAGRGA
jgi:hypothetical protein